MTPKVSVCIITYNHERFIQRAIESALSQRTTFPFDIIVGDDSSTDDTQPIIHRLREERPDIIRIIPAEPRVGMTLNLQRVLFACTGKYIALLEGDDYWTDENKLQRQVEFLESHPEYSLSFHNAIIQREREDGTVSRSKARGSGIRKTFGMRDILRKNFIPTHSAVLRGSIARAIPDWCTRYAFVDWPLFILAAMKGKIHYLPQCMGVYRIHPRGASGLGQWGHEKNILIYKDMLRFYETIDPILDHRYHSFIKSRLAHTYLGLAILYHKSGDAKNSHLMMRSALKIRPTPLTATKALAASVFMRL